MRWRFQDGEYPNNTALGSCLAEDLLASGLFRTVDYVSDAELRPVPGEDVIIAGQLQEDTVTAYQMQYYLGPAIGWLAWVGVPETARERTVRYRVGVLATESGRVVAGRQIELMFRTPAYRSLYADMLRISLAPHEEYPLCPTELLQQEFSRVRAAVAEILDSRGVEVRRR